MNCRESRRLMHLDRPGERTDRETKAWLEHLAGCPACQAEADNAGKLRAVEELLRTSAVAIPDLSDVRARVLAATTAHVRSGGRRAQLPRMAYALAVTAVVAWFSVEQWRVRTAHVALHERSNQPVPTAVGPRIVYTVDASEARRLTTGAGALPPGLIAHGTIEVPQATALKWMDNAPSYLAGTLTRRSVQRAQIADAIRVLQSAVEVAIRYRPKGA